MEQKDERLWRTAQKRANFRRSLFAYLVVNAFLWGIWWFSGGNFENDHRPWPIWPMLGWGLALAFQYFKAYNGTKEDLAEREYERLKREQQG